MNIGKLRHRLALQSGTPTQDAYGEVTYSWSTYTTVWGSLQPVAGREVESMKQISEEITFKAVIRYNSTVASEHRISFDSRTFEVVTVQNFDERNRETDPFIEGGGMSGIGMTVTGVKEVQKMLEKLERKESAKIVKKETRDAQKKVMLPPMKSSASSVVGGEMGAAISKNMTVRAMGRSPKGKPMHRGSYGAKVIIKATDYFVAFSKGSSFDINTKKQLTGTRNYIPNAIEFGHAGPGDARSGDKVAAPKPFMRPVYESHRKKLAEQFARNVIRAIEQAAKV